MLVISTPESTDEVGAWHSRLGLVLFGDNVFEQPVRRQRSNDHAVKYRREGLHEDRRVSEGTNEGWADDTSNRGMEMKGPFLVALGVGTHVGQATEDTVTQVVVDGQQLSLSIILLHPKERGTDGVKRYLVVLHCSDRVVGNALKVVAVRQVQIDVNKVRVLWRFVPIPQVEVIPKFFEILCILEEAVAQ